MDLWKGVAVNVGCGPNHLGQLDSLRHAVEQYQPGSTLVFADLEPAGIENPTSNKGLTRVRVARVNAATTTQTLAAEQVDLVLAFGLFGALSPSTVSDGTGKAAWPAVLAECFKLLKPLGNLIVSNSCDRQPFDEFKEAVERAGFVVREEHESNAYRTRGSSQDPRYLVVCEKQGSRKSEIGECSHPTAGRSKARQCRPDRRG
jgi:hypothetical protein